jgi:hypothetical protein
VVDYPAETTEALPAAVVGLQIGGRGQTRTLPPQPPGQKRPRAITQNVGQPVGQNPGCISLTTSSLDTAYRSLGGEVEARPPQPALPANEKQSSPPWPFTLISFLTSLKRYECELSYV